jgi:GNAT superfamily N-acetyltransferase
LRRPDPGLRGPERAGVEDIDAINRLFTEAFTERYHRDGMTGVRVPPLNRAIWRYAIAGAGEGAMLWRDAAGELAGFAMVHQSGSEGWMGPIAVRSSLQGAGFGTRIVRSGIAWLQRRGARTIGLETMPRTVENIGFYSRLGLEPGHLTISVVKEAERHLELPPGATLLSAETGREAGLAACRALADRVAPGVDYSRELILTEEQQLGDTTLLSGPEGLRGFALWHSAPLAQGRSGEEIRLLKVVATDTAAFLEVVAAAERHGASMPAVHRVSVRCQAGFASAYAGLLGAGFRVHWTDLRMTLRDYGERVTGAAVVMSNWEI